jgi:hypothetical protein
MVSIIKELGYEKSEVEIRAALNKFDMNMASKVQKNVEKENWNHSLRQNFNDEEASSKLKLIDVILLNLQRKKIKFKRKRKYLENRNKFEIKDNLNEVNENAEFWTGTSKLKKLVNVRNMLEIQKKCPTTSKRFKSKRSFTG